MSHIDLERMKAMQRTADDNLNRERNMPTPIYVGDVENMLMRVASHVPLIDNEAVYLFELDTQERFFLVFCIIGLLMFILGMMI